MLVYLFLVHEVATPALEPGRKVFAFLSKRDEGKTCGC